MYAAKHSCIVERLVRLPFTVQLFKPVKNCGSFRNWWFFTFPQYLLLAIYFDSQTTTQNTLRFPPPPPPFVRALSFHINLFIYNYFFYYSKRTESIYKQIVPCCLSFSGSGARPKRYAPLCKKKIIPPNKSAYNRAKLITF